MNEPRFQPGPWSLAVPCKDTCAELTEHTRQTKCCSYWISWKARAKVNASMEGDAGRHGAKKLQPRPVQSSKFQTLHSRVRERQIAADWTRTLSLKCIQGKGPATDPDCIGPSQARHKPKFIQMVGTTCSSHWLINPLLFNFGKNMILLQPTRQQDKHIRAMAWLRWPDIQRRHQPWPDALSCCIIELFV